MRIVFPILGIALLIPGFSPRAQDVPAFKSAVVPGHVPPAAGEHPRLILRKADVGAARKAAQTEWGRKIVARIHQATKLAEKLPIAGRNRESIREAGFRAAGYGAQYLLSEDATFARQALTVITREIIGYPLNSGLPLTDRAARLRGTAQGYDLCYDAWDAPSRERVRAFIASEIGGLSEALARRRRSRPGTYQDLAVRSALAMAAMATLGESGDADARARIDAGERTVLAYLRHNIAEGGFDIDGESVRQAAFASHILPFLYAQQTVVGRSIAGHPAVAAVILPAVHQYATGSGLVVVGRSTPTIDRTGFFPMAAGLVPTSQRPVVAWLFREFGGDRSLGFVRPHHGLYMLGNVLGTTRPAAPGKEWPRYVRSMEAKYVSMRTGWDGPESVLAAVHDRSINILGLGTPWVSCAGSHAHCWSHDPGAGSLRSIFGINPKLHNQAIYRVQESGRLVAGHPHQAGDRASFAFAFKGSAERLAGTVRVRKKGEKHAKEFRIPEGGAFEGTRVFGVDYTGKSGAPAVFAVADRLTGVPGAWRVWVLHAGFDLAITLEENAFTLEGENATLRGTVVYPSEVELGKTSIGKGGSFVTVTSTEPRMDVVMTLQRGNAPRAVLSADGLLGGVSVGGRTIRLQEHRIVFGE